MCSHVVRPKVGPLVSPLTDRSTQEKSSSRVKRRRKVERRENYCKEGEVGNKRGVSSVEFIFRTLCFLYSQDFGEKRDSEFDHSVSRKC